LAAVAELAGLAALQPSAVAEPVDCGWRISGLQRRSSQVRRPNRSIAAGSPAGAAALQPSAAAEPVDCGWRISGLQRRSS